MCGRVDVDVGVGVGVGVSLGVSLCKCMCVWKTKEKKIFCVKESHPLDRGNESSRLAVSKAKRLPNMGSNNRVK